MAFLVANVPPVKVWVKKQYLYDLQKGHGEYVQGIWATVKSIQGRALYFETYIPDYAALYDKLPISAFVSSPDVKEDLPLIAQPTENRHHAYYEDFQNSENKFRFDLLLNNIKKLINMDIKDFAKSLKTKSLFKEFPTKFQSLLRFFIKLYIFSCFILF